MAGNHIIESIPRKDTDAGTRRYSQIPLTAKAMAELLDPELDDPVPVPVEDAPAPEFVPEAEVDDVEEEFDCPFVNTWR